MKKLCVLLMIVCLAVLPMNAKSLRSMWCTMPDSLLLGTNGNIRLELVELMEMGVKAEVNNLLSADCVLDTLSADYLHLTTSKVATFELMALPRIEKDTVFCVIKTFSAPEKESDVRFYDDNWKELDGQSFFEGGFSQLGDQLVGRPDTLSELRYKELTALLEPRMFFAELEPKGKVITFQLSLPLVSDEQKMKLNAVLMQRKFKWNGKIFKKI